MNAGTIIFVVVCVGCAALFFGIGVWACKRKTPMHFWAGTEIDPVSISDLIAYNRENGRMWMVYSIPFWLSGVLAVMNAISPRPFYPVAALVIMVLACTFGLWWLMKTYSAIEKKYKVNREKA